MVEEVVETTEWTIKVLDIDKLRDVSYDMDQLEYGSHYMIKMLDRDYQCEID